MNTPLLTVENLRVHYAARGREITALSDVSITLAPGETLGIVGESGSGKSTLGLSLMGLLQRNARMEGTIRIDDTDLMGADARTLNAIRGKTVGLVYQDALAALNPVRTVGSQIAEVMTAHLAMSRSEAHEATIAALAGVGITDPASRFRQFPHEFSGGMRQRAAIAMALAARPRLLIADEPTTALDVTVQAQILTLLARLRRDTGMSMIIISHDLEVIREISDRIAVLYHGRIVETGATREVMAAPAHPYTQALIRSAPTVEAPVISFIPGAPPAPGVQFEGCSFQPRCPVGAGKQICRAQRPLLRPADSRTTIRSACHFS